jgi:hypothetical protein
MRDVLQKKMSELVREHMPEHTPRVDLVPAGEEVDPIAEDIRPSGSRVHGGAERRRSVEAVHGRPRQHHDDAPIVGAVLFVQPDEIHARRVEDARRFRPGPFDLVTPFPHVASRDELYSEREPLFTSCRMRRPQGSRTDPSCYRSDSRVH